MFKFETCLPQEIVRLIVLEFNPTALREFLATELCNRYAEEISRKVIPDYQQRHFVRTSSISGMAYLLMTCRWFELDTKWRKSRKHLKLINYKDFKKMDSILRGNFLTLNKRKCLKAQIRV